MSPKTLFVIILGLVILVGASIFLLQQQIKRAPSGTPLGSSAIGHGNLAVNPAAPEAEGRP